jgi:hypothetical protein
MSSTARFAGREPAIEILALFYVVSYMVCAVLTRQVATVSGFPSEAAPAGLNILPAATLLSGIITYAFVAMGGWWRDAHTTRLFGHPFPRPIFWTVLSGLGAALLLVTVPLSFTLGNVSIPFMQLLMRGDVLLVAPLVDVLMGRRVRWFSWVAISLICVGLWLAAGATRPLSLPPAAIVIAALYTFGHFLRLLAMTKVAKTGDARLNRGYFVEEKLVAIPAALLILVFWQGSHSDQPLANLHFAFVGVWSGGRLLSLCLISILMFVTSVVSFFMLLDRRDNTFCVPFERSASVLAAFAAAYVLAAMNLGVPPNSAELAGAALLFCAMALLSLAPKPEQSARAKLSLL